MALLEVVPSAPALREADGALRIGRSHVALETVLWAFQQGSTPEDIRDQFPTLELADVYDVVAYYLRHREPVDAYLARQAASHQAAPETLKSAFPVNRLRTALEDRRRG